MTEVLLENTIIP